MKSSRYPKNIYPNDVHKYLHTLKQDIIDVTLNPKTTSENEQVGISNLPGAREWKLVNLYLNLKRAYSIYQVTENTPIHDEFNKSWVSLTEALYEFYEEKKVKNRERFKTYEEEQTLRMSQEGEHESSSEEIANASLQTFPLKLTNELDWQTLNQLKDYLALDVGKMVSVESNNEKNVHQLSSLQKELFKIHFNEKGQVVRTIFNVEFGTNQLEMIQSTGKVNKLTSKKKNAGISEPIFVIGFNGQIYFNSDEARKDAGISEDDTRIFNHSSFLSREPVVCGGTLTIDDEGRIAEISNMTGHYRSDSRNLLLAIQQLSASGADLTKATVEIINSRGDITKYHALLYLQANQDKAFCNGEIAKSFAEYRAYRAREIDIAQHVPAYIQSIKKLMGENKTFNHELFVGHFNHLLSEINFTQKDQPENTHSHQLALINAFITLFPAQKDIILLEAMRINIDVSFLENPLIPYVPTLDNAWIENLAHVRDYLSYILEINKNTLSNFTKSFIREQLHLIHLFDKNPAYFMRKWDSEYIPENDRSYEQGAYTILAEMMENGYRQAILMPNDIFFQHFSAHDLMIKAEEYYLFREKELQEQRIKAEEQKNEQEYFNVDEEKYREEYKKREERKEVEKPKEENVWEDQLNEDSDDEDDKEKSIENIVAIMEDNPINTEDIPITNIYQLVEPSFEQEAYYVMRSYQVIHDGDEIFLKEYDSKSPIENASILNLITHHTTADFKLSQDDLLDLYDQYIRERDLNLYAKELIKEGPTSAIDVPLAVIADLEDHIKNGSVSTLNCLLVLMNNSAIFTILSDDGKQHQADNLLNFLKAYSEFIETPSRRNFEKIYERFINPDSPEEINIVAKIRKPLLEFHARLQHENPPSPREVIDGLKRAAEATAQLFTENTNLFIGNDFQNLEYEIKKLGLVHVEDELEKLSLDEKNVLQKRSVALLEVDGTLLRMGAADNRNMLINHSLINSLKENGIQDLYLSTFMDLKTLHNEYQKNENERTWEQLIATLENAGFKIHGVITPADLSYDKGLGAVHADYIDPQQQRIINGELKITEQGLMPDEDYVKDLEIVSRLTQEAMENTDNQERLKTNLYRYFLEQKPNWVGSTVYATAEPSDYLKNISNFPLAVIQVEGANSNKDAFSSNIIVQSNAQMSYNTTIKDLHQDLPSQQKYQLYKTAVNFKQKINDQINIQAERFAKVKERFHEACENLHSAIILNRNSKLKAVGRQVLHNAKKVIKENVVPNEDYPLLTRFLNGTANCLEKPKDDLALEAHANNINKAFGIGRKWGALIGGGMGAAFGAILIAASIGIAVATFGVATPLSALGVAIGTTIVVSAALGGTGLLASAGMFAHSARKGSVAVAGENVQEEVDLAPLKVAKINNKNF